MRLQAGEVDSEQVIDQVHGRLGGHVVGQSGQQMGERQLVPGILLSGLRRASSAACLSRCMVSSCSRFSLFDFVSSNSIMMNSSSFQRRACGRSLLPDRAEAVPV